MGRPAIADQSGNLYGAAAGGGFNNGGVVFELAHPGSWTYNLLYSFSNDSTPTGTLASTAPGTCTAQRSAAVPMAMAQRTN